MEIKNAMIQSTMLGLEDHGILTCWLNLKYADGGQGFGGWALDVPVKDGAGKFLYRAGTAKGMQFVAKILSTVGVDSWEKLPGKAVRVEADSGKVYRIGHLIENRWFDPKEVWGTDR